MGFFFINLCLLGCISSHFEAHFSISYNPSILSKVSHSNTLFLTISFAFPCQPLGALIRFPSVCVLGGGGGGGGGGHSNCNDASLS